jgi:hypothetical protein
MFTISLTSGLGNQLFQYFFGESLKIDNEVEVRYLDTLLPPKQINLWEIFDINLNIKKIDELKEYNFFIKKNKYIFINLIKLAIKFKINQNYNIYSDNNFDNKKNINKDYNFLFYGYWQNRYYFNKHFNRIRNQIKFKKLLSLNFLDSKISNFKEVVGVHIRGGDYLKKKNRKIFTEISSNYYQENIYHLKKILVNPLFLFFSDDTNYLHKIIKDLDIEFRYFYELNPNPINDFQYLSQCDHFIIPNSTFSLWASYFSENLNKTVIKPKNWFK